MTPKSLLGLAAVTVASVALAAALARGGATGAVADRGRVLIPDLAARSAGISAVAVITGKGETDLTRQGDGFVDAAGYPVRLDAVRALVTSMATLTVFEDKTDRADRYADLGLAEPAASSGGATEVVLKGKDGAAIATLFAGTKDYTVGGSRGGQYVRLGGAATSYLVRGAVDVPSARSDWFDTRLADVGLAAFAKADFIDAAGTAVPLAIGGGKLALATPPDGRVADDTRLAALGRLFQRLDFTDVRKAAGEIGAGGRFSVETRDGLALVMTEVAGGDGPWVRISAASMAPGAADAAKAIAAKVDGFDFRLPKTVSDALGWKLEDLLKPADKP